MIGILIIMMGAGLAYVCMCYPELLTNHMYHWFFDIKED